MESDGCYSMVGENRFTGIVFGLAGESPEPTNIISVRPGDVVGYFTATYSDVRNTGIRLNPDLIEQSVWYHNSISEEPPMQGDQLCPFRVDAIQLGSETIIVPVASQPAGAILDSFTTQGPVISARIGTQLDIVLMHS